MDEFVKELFEKHRRDRHSQTVATADYTSDDLLPRPAADEIEIDTLDKVKKAIEGSSLFGGDMSDQRERLLEFFNSCNRFAKYNLATLEAVICEELPYFGVVMCAKYFSLNIYEPHSLQSILGSANDVIIFSVPQKNNSCIISVSFDFEGTK